MGIYSLMNELTALSERDDRGALASLRRLLGERRGYTQALRYVVPHLSQKDNDRSTRDLLLVAGLFGMHPSQSGSTDKSTAARIRRRNMGDVYRLLSHGNRDENDSATERRFNHLLEAHKEQIEPHLRQAIGLAKSAKPSVAIDYVQLYWDLQKWQLESRTVQFNWARSFYGTFEIDDDSPQGDREE